MYDLWELVKYAIFIDKGLIYKEWGPLIFFLFMGGGFSQRYLRSTGLSQAEYEIGADFNDN